MKAAAIPMDRRRFHQTGTALERSRSLGGNLRTVDVRFGLRRAEADLDGPLHPSLRGPEAGGDARDVGTGDADVRQHAVVELRQLGVGILVLAPDLVGGGERLE